MPEYYRDQVGGFYLQQLSEGASQKDAMLKTRQQFKGRGGKMISRASVYRYADGVRKARAAAAKAKRRKL